MVTYSDMFTYTLVLCAVATLVASICNKKPKNNRPPATVTVIFNNLYPKG